MKKIVLLLLVAFSLPVGMMAQSNDDDLYFVPSRDKEREEVKPMVKKEPKVKTGTTTTLYTSPGTTVVVEDRKGNRRDTRDVDEYNRRYSAKDNEFERVGDTLYVKEKAVSDLDGEWVNGFNGSQDDYEYAERIIRFRNPRFAVSISSPLYWDIVYGTNPWDWNVYTDGFYAYAFPTFTNRLWWDWRYNYGPGWGWGWGWSPYYAWGGYYPGYWGGWYGGGYWGPHWGHHHGYYPGWGGGHWARNTYTNRRSTGRSSYGSGSTVRRYGSGATRREGTTVRSSNTSSYGRSGQSSARRVIGTRSVGERNGTTTRTDASSSRRSTYTRPSSTRRSSTYEGTRNSTTSPSRVGTSSSTRRSSTYNRGSSTAPSRTRATESTRRSYNNTNSSTRSYSSPSRSSSGSSRSYSTGGGGSSRSSGGGGGASRSRR